MFNDMSYRLLSQQKNTVSSNVQYRECGVASEAYRANYTSKYDTNFYRFTVRYSRYRACSGFTGPLSFSKASTALGTEQLLIVQKKQFLHSCLSCAVAGDIYRHVIVWFVYTKCTFLQGHQLPAGLHLSSGAWTYIYMTHQQYRHISPVRNISGRPR